MMTMMTRGFDARTQMTRINFTYSLVHAPGKRCEGLVESRQLIVALTR